MLNWSTLHLWLINILFVIFQTLPVPCLPRVSTDCCTTTSPRKSCMLLMGHLFGYHFFADNISFCLCPFLASWTPCSPTSSHQKPVAICNKKNYYLLHASVQNIFPTHFPSWNPGLPTFVKQYKAVETGQWQLKSLIPYFLSHQCNFLASFCWFYSAKGKDYRIRIWPNFLSLL